MRRVPSLTHYISNLFQSPVENLIQLTLDQAKARGQSPKELEKDHSRLRTAYRLFDDYLEAGYRARLNPAPFTSPSALFGNGETELYFRELIYTAYLLGSASPEPNRIKGLKRVDKALKKRKKGWEEALDEAIALTFKAAAPVFPKDKEIIRTVEAEMKSQGYKTLPIKDDALRKRIQRHRQRAKKNEGVPF